MSESLLADDEKLPETDQKRLSLSKENLRLLFNQLESNRLKNVHEKKESSEFDHTIVESSESSVEIRNDEKSPKTPTKKTKTEDPKDFESKRDRRGEESFKILDDQPDN